MTIPVLPPYDAPFKPVPQVTPFTYRDGETMLKKLERMKKYINTVLVPFVNDNYSDLADAFEEQVNLLIDAVNAAIDAVINSSIVVQDPVVATLVNDDDSQTTTALEAKYALKSVVDALTTQVNGIGDTINNGRLSIAGINKRHRTVSVADYGAIGDGVADDTTAINTAIAATGDGYTLDLAGTHRVTSPISVSDKSIHIDGKSGTLLIDHNDEGISINGTWGPSFAATGIVAISATDAVSGAAHTDYEITLTVAPPTDWKIGDVIKIAADDQIEGDRYASGNICRVGTYLTFVKAVGTKVTCSGFLNDNFTTNIRIGKVYDLDVSIRDMTIAYTDTAFSGQTGNAIIINKLRSPKISNVFIPRVKTSGIVVRECINWNISQVEVGYGINDLTTGGNGYGISASCCAYGTLENSRFTMVRHAYSNGAPRKAAGLTDLDGYGRCDSNRIVNCEADSCTETGWDTHTQSVNETFVNCTVKNCPTGFSFRGKAHSVINGRVYNCATGFRFTEESDIGDSWGHTVNGLFCDTVDMIARGQVRTLSTNPNVGIIDNRPTTIRNVHAKNVRSRMGISYNCIIIAENWFVENNVTNTAVGWLLNNARILFNNLIVNVVPGSGNLTNIITFSSSTGISRAEINRLRVLGNIAANFNYVVNGSNNTQEIRLTDIVMDAAPSLGLKQLTYTTVGVIPT